LADYALLQATGGQRFGNAKCLQSQKKVRPGTDIATKVTDITLTDLERI
jgi:hypothetical protein